MQVLYVILLGFAVSVMAQVSLPVCADECIKLLISNQTACLPTDTACLCADSSLSMAIQGCLMGACTLKESLSTVNATNAICGVASRDRSNILIIVAVVFGTLALTAIMIRTVTSLQQRVFGVDDFCAVVAYLFSASVTFGQIACGTLGFGKDTWAVRSENITLILKIVYFNQLSYLASSGFSKLCFLFMFLRIFPAQRTKNFVWFGIMASVVFVLAFGLPFTFACRPISATWTAWDMEIEFEYCINQQVFWFVAAGCNIALDVYIVLIPIPELLTLSLSTRKKLMLIAIFSTGTITIMVSIARLWALAQYGSSTNPIYDNVLSGIFSPLELNVGIVCLCMPAFRRLVVQMPLRHGSGGASSSNKNPKYRQYSHSTPNERMSSGKKSTGKFRDSLGGSLFHGTIMKTVDMIVEERRATDDEMQLVELQRDGKNACSEQKGVNIHHNNPEHSYKAQHIDNALPEDW